MIVRYPVPAAEHVFEQEIKQSRFIATVTYAPDAAAARARIAEIAARYPDATHNCWAFLAGIGPGAEFGMSDDGEPGGTAGRPMLMVLQGSGIGDIAAVVTRYFGGVKLGSGGLVRAYGGTLQKALATLPLREQVVRRSGLLIVDYAQYEQLRRLLSSCDALIQEEHFAAQVTLRVALPLDQWETCAAAVRDLSNGSVELLPLDAQPVSSE
ncbi:MAG: hypothetical protein KatS3mg057_2580 [Herpetosiphonaceae bacterium]|nr:MAG: hypothetical protein KatS3mg057_2580 [Herpetosiphonaceae bacterium]